MQLLSVLIVDPYPLVRLAITQLLKTTVPNLILKETSSTVTIQEIIQHQKFDLLIMDNHLSVDNNLNLVETIRQTQPNVKILYFSDRSEQHFALSLFHAGVNGFVSKDSSEEDFKTALAQILDGSKYLDKKMQQNIVNDILEGMPAYAMSTSPALTSREMEVMDLLLRGYRTAEISNEMNLRPSTISTFKMKIMKKMRVNNIMELSEKVKTFDPPFLRHSARIG